MLCKHCGTEFSDDVKMCQKCGKEKDGIPTDGQNPFAPPKHASTAGFTTFENWSLRAHARQQLKGAWGKIVLAFFLYVTMLSTLQFVFYDFGLLFYNPLHDPVLYIIANIAAYGTMGAFSLGFAGLYLKKARGQAISVKNIFGGFKRFIPSFLAMFFLVLFTALWGLLLVIPGIIKLLGYFMVFFIMHDNPGMGPLKALKKSRIMMKGYKGKFFMLNLSFIGWFVLGALTLGIGYLWIYPYYYLSITNFYEALKRNEEAATGTSIGDAPPPGLV